MQEIHNRIYYNYNNLETKIFGGLHMKANHSIIFLILLIFLLGIVGPALPAAHAQTNTCTVLVERALNEIGGNCANPARNSACYGYNSVQADFTETVPENFFSQPSDRASLSLLQSVQTAPLDATAGTWGIATLDVQASLPGALPGQNLVYILLGGVMLENAVPPEDTLTLPAQPVEVMTAAAADLRRDPLPDAEVVGTVEADTPLLADAVSPDGDWLRVFFMANRLAIAWVHQDAVTSTPETESLPVAGPNSHTPMQAFAFQTGIGETECAEAPSVLFIQGPEDIEVELNANGADIWLASSIVLRTLPGNLMQVTVLGGGVSLNPNSESPILLPPGFTATCPMDTISLGNCDWSLPRTITQAEQALLAALRPLFDNIPNLLHYLPSVPNLICASGVGGAVCELSFDNPQVVLAWAAEQCALGQLPASMCDVLFPGS